MIINSKLSDSFKKRRLINLLRTINKIVYGQFYYRLILLYLFKSNLDLNSNMLITFLNKGFNHKYLFTLYHALSLNLTKNSNYPESNHSLINYVSATDKMNNPNNKQIINKYLNENPKIKIYKKKSFTKKSSNKYLNLSVDEFDKNLVNNTFSNAGNDISLNGTINNSFISQRPPAIIRKTINLKK